MPPLLFLYLFYVRSFYSLSSTVNTRLLGALTFLFLQIFILTTKVFPIINVNKLFARAIFFIAIYHKQFKNLIAFYRAINKKKSIKFRLEGFVWFWQQLILLRQFKSRYSSDYTIDIILRKMYAPIKMSCCLTVVTITNWCEI